MDLPSATHVALSGPAPSTPGATPGSVYRSGGQFSSNREVAKVQANYLALANDLEQAQSLASALELQLSGKTNELANFKLIWERTQADLVKFAADLDTMRKERHALANDAQRGYAFELKLQKLTVAHGDLTTRAERLEAELIRERAAHVETRAELERLREKGGNPQPASGNLRDAGLRTALETLREHLDRVLPPVGGATPGVPSRSKTPAPAHIDIEFSS
jgi:hypothetical protein